MRKPHDRSRESVEAFTGGAEQFDDMTMMCLEYCGPGGA